MKIDYDPYGDVLYIVKTKAPASRGEEDHGLVWRYGRMGNLLGLTVMDYADYWSKNRKSLEAEMAKKFRISPAMASQLLNDAERVVGSH